MAVLLLSPSFYILGAGESMENPLISMMADFTTSAAFRQSGKSAFESAGIKQADADHVMIYDAFAHLPFFGLEDLGFCKRGEAKYLYRERRTAPGGDFPINTNGGGLSYMHSGMYGMYALQESVRQMRGVAAAQVPGAKVSVCHGVGNMFTASGTVIFTNEA
jgi:acetyl-CoA acetyltransferase